MKSTLRAFGATLSQVCASASEITPCSCVQDGAMSISLSLSVSILQKRLAIANAACLKSIRSYAVVYQQLSKALDIAEKNKFDVTAQSLLMTTVPGVSFKQVTEMGNAATTAAQRLNRT